MVGCSEGFCCWLKYERMLSWIEHQEDPRCSAHKYILVIESPFEAGDHSLSYCSWHGAVATSRKPCNDHEG